MAEESLAGILRARRAQRGLSLQQLADRLGVSPAYVSLMERGERVPSSEVVAKLAEVLIYPAELLTLRAGRVPDDLQKTMGERIPEVAALLREREELTRRTRILSEERAVYVTAADGRPDSNGPRAPFTGELVAGKNSVVYNAHSYHTKVPPEAITPLIEHYSSPKDVVLDPFCGSGMTGVAAIRAGRHAILSDLSPAAVHIASNYCTPCDPSALRETAEHVLEAVRPTLEWLYESGDGLGQIEYTLWSDVFCCPHCRTAASYWESTYDSECNELREASRCPACGELYKKDHALWVSEEPVLASVASDTGRGKRVQRAVTAREREHIADVDATPIPFWYPRTPFGAEREMWRASHAAMGIDSVDKFYSRRNLHALAALRHRILDVSDDRLMRALMFAFTGCVNRASRRYQWNPKRPTNVMTGTLYISSLRYEFNVRSLFRRKLAAIERYFTDLGRPGGRAEVCLSNATNLSWIPDGSVHYAFTDPPFGSNIYYADSSLLWEAWLDRHLDESQEAVISRKRTREQGGKDIPEYQRLMTESFAEIYRALKPGRYASIAFNNTNDSVWRAIQAAIGDAGFRIQSTSGLDKVHRSIKGVKGQQGIEEIALFDVIMNVERPQRFGSTAVSTEQEELEPLLREVFREHLGRLDQTRSNGTSPRRTEYLHSLAVRTLLERGVTIRALSFEDVERVAGGVAVRRNAEWFLPEEGTEENRYTSIQSPYGVVMREDLADVRAFVERHRTSERGRGAVVSPEAFATEVRGSRNTPVYNAHSYPTKVPPEAIIPFIEHYTQPGDLVLDPFAGSGMTGVAACLTGRRAILNDLSVIGAHLAYNHTTPCDPTALIEEFETLYGRTRPEFERLYWTSPDERLLPHIGAAAGYAHYTLWSVVYECSFCRQAFPLWEVAVDPSTGQVDSTFPCPGCRMLLTKGRLRRLGSKPVLISTQLPSGQRIERAPTDADLEHITRIEAEPIADWYPDLPFSQDREMYIRSALHLQGISQVSDFYTKRNLRALGRIWREINQLGDYRIRRAMQFAFTNTAWHGTRMRRYNALGGQRPLTGTLYIPQLSSEVNVLEVMRNKIRQLATFYGKYKPVDPFVAPALRVGSATDLSEIPDACVDYAFFDPPFGSNLFYADLNFVLESWLGAVTKADEEAVVNRSLPEKRGGKTVADYQRIMTAALIETGRVLKPGRWASVMFHNTDPEVWRAFQDAAEDAGFEVVGATGLNRAELSMKGYKGLSDLESVAHHDVIVSMRRRVAKSTNGRRPSLPEERIVSELTQYLSEADVNAPRTTQYLHSLSLRFLVGNGYEASSVSFPYIRDLCRRHFEWRRGGWHIAGPEHTLPPVNLALPLIGS